MEIILAFFATLLLGLGFLFLLWIIVRPKRKVKIKDKPYNPKPDIVPAPQHSQQELINWYKKK